jgi:uncharacterized membrane-anchored protein YitT (DUF2179 family)
MIAAIDVPGEALPAMRRFFAYLQITIGTLIGALAVNLFMLPNHLPSGGLNGLLLICYYLWKVPIGPAYFLANLPALAFLFKIQGWKGLLRTVYGIGSFSLFVEWTRPLAAHAPTHNLLLATIYGGGLMGLGLGLALRAGGSTGGTSAIARVVFHYTGFDVGKFLLVTDMLILAFGAVMLSVESILYGVLMTFLVMRLVQAVQEGFTTSRCLLIISSRPDEISAAIRTELKRGATRLDAIGEQTGVPRPVLMCVVAESEVHRAKRLVLSTDPEAFLVIADAREVAGRGFTLDTEIRRIPFWVGQGD